MVQMDMGLGYWVPHSQPIIETCFNTRVSVLGTTLIAIDRESYLELELWLVGRPQELDEPWDGAGGDERLDRRVPLTREDLPRRLHRRELHCRVRRGHSGLLRKNSTM